MATLFFMLAGEGRNFFFSPEAVHQRGLVVTNAYTEWLRFDVESTLVSDRGYNYDTPVYLRTVRKTDRQIQVAYQTTKVEMPDLSTPDSGVTIIGGNQVVISGNVTEPEIYDLQVTIDDKSALLSLNLFPEKSVYDVAIDAGSEASQLMIHRRGDESRCSRHPIVEGLKRHFQIPNEGPFDQEEDDNEVLYLSRFFWNRKNENRKNEKGCQSHFGLPYDPASPFLFLSHRSLAEKELLPAVKVHYLSEILNRRPWSISKIYQAILAKFVFEAVYQIADGHPAGKIAVVVNLLVPNMLSQNDHSALAQEMNEFVQSKDFQNHKPKDLDAYVEVRLVSESDGSLLGILEGQSAQLEGRYAVIDMGKGTTDISVVDVNSARAVAVSRLGFIGAGNVVSNAVFQEAVLHFVPLSEYSKKLKELLSLEPAKLWRIEKAVDRLKRMNQRRELKVESTKPDLELDPLIEKIENLEAIPSTYQLVEQAMDRLVSEIAKCVPAKVDFICLTGRAFLFSPLRERVIKALKNRAKSISFDEYRAKEVCLQGILSPRRLETQRIGVPMAYDCRKGTAGPTLKERVREHVLSSCNSWFSLQRISSAWKNLRDRIDGNVSPIEEKPVQQSMEPQVVDDENLVMMTGVVMETFGTSTRFQLGNEVYFARDMQTDGKTRLFFDGSQYFVRTPESRYLLQKSMAKVNHPLFLAESLFPYALKFDRQLIFLGTPKIQTK